jgi:hypothetical protein
MNGQVLGPSWERIAARICSGGDGSLAKVLSSLVSQMLVELQIFKEFVQSSKCAVTHPCKHTHGHLTKSLCLH